MKIVITGALGHIGSQLIRDLPIYFPEAQLVLIDNLSTQRYCSLYDLPDADYRFVEADILKTDLFAHVQGARAVIHLAAVTDATNSFNRQHKVEKVNYFGTELVAVACARAGVPLLFPSTTSVYGSQDSLVDEDCQELRPQSPYAAAKLRAERALVALSATTDLRYVICRFGTIFGTSIGMRFHTAVNKFCWQAALGQPLTVWSTALEQYRPYLALDDATRAIVHIIEEELFDQRVYNVLSTNATVIEIVKLIARYKPDVRVSRVDTPIMNQLSYHVSDRRFRATGFRPSGTLERGIAETLQLFANLADQPVMA